MKLWQKTYLLSALTCVLILLGCMFFTSAPVVSLTVESGMRSAKTEEHAIVSALEQTVSGVPERRRGTVAAEFLRNYENSELMFEFRKDDEIIYSTLPFSVERKKGTAGFIRNEKELYVFLHDELPSGYDLIYLKKDSALGSVLSRQLLTSALIGTSVALFMVTVLYILLYRVNLPVSRLAHEMRTPLTVMRGYAETLRDTRLTEEQKHLAASYIADESTRLAEISNRLLTMHSREEEGTCFEPIDLEELFAHLNHTYPTLTYQILCPALVTDRTMFSSLLGNLIENAVNASEGIPVELTAEKNRITVIDHGKGLSDEELRYLNHPSKLKPLHAKGGIGIPLCHQIAKALGAKLSFIRTEDGGTKAEIAFYNSVAS